MKKFSVMTRFFGVAVFSAMCFLTCSNDNDGNFALNPEALQPQRPSAPTGVSASAQSSSSIRISWNYSSNATEYLIYRSTNLNGPFNTPIGTTSISSYTDNGLSANTTYYYRVAGSNRSGTGNLSSVVSATTSPPPTSNNCPTSATVLTANTWASGSIASSGTREEWFRFTATASTQYIHFNPGALNDVNVQLYNSSCATVGTATNLWSSNLYMSRSVTSGQTYYIKVTPYYSSGFGAYQIAFNTSTSRPSTSSPSVPTTPTGVSATVASQSSITISWSSVSGATGYRVYRDTSLSGTFTQMVGNTTATSYTNTGLTVGTTYYYRVSAYNSAGESAQSNVVGAIITQEAPAAPTGVVATAISSSSIRISWLAVTGATGYYLLYSMTGTGGWSEFYAETDTTSYTHTGLLDNTTYYYRVVARNSGGDSEWSNVVSATTFYDGTGDIGSQFNPNINYDTLFDNRDGKAYLTVRMPDGKEWMAENLNYIPTASGSASNSWCYGNDPANCEIYGRLYDWATAMNLPASCNTQTLDDCGILVITPRGVCPNGWRLPYNEDWDSLMIAVGGANIAGTKLKSSTGWTDQGLYAPVGTNDYGFSALPGGYRWGGSFSGVGSWGRWWSATEIDADDARVRNMYYDVEHVYSGWDDKRGGHSVRCVRD